MTNFTSPRKLELRALAGALLLAMAGTVPAAAQDAAEQARRDAIARVAAQQFAEARNDAGHTRELISAAAAAAPFDLTVQEAVARALERNLELAVERLNPQTFDLSIARLKAVYRPMLTSTFGQRSFITPPTSTLNGGTIVDLDTTTMNTTMRQELPWFGGDVAFQFNNSKQVTSNLFANYNPAFTNDCALTWTQPLLRGFLIDSTRQQLRVTALNRDISEIQLRGTIATTLAAVRNAYWELLYAIQAVEVARHP